MLKRALASLIRSADGAGVLTVGGVLTLLTWTVTPLWVVGVVAFPPLVALGPLALAPAFVARGYFVRVLADAAKTGNAGGAPPFVAWNELYRNGVKSAALSAVLLAPLALCFALVAAAGVVLGTELVGPTALVDRAERMLGTRGIVAVGGVGAGVFAVVSTAYLVAFAYVRPAALSAFAATGRLRDGLRPKRVGRVAGSGSYATAWVVAAVTLLIGYAVATPFIPVIVGVVIVFATRIVAHSLYGRGARAVLSVGTEPDAADSEAGAARPAIAPPAPPEAPPAVQSGRAVPFGGEIDGLVGSDGGEVGGAIDRGAVGDDEGDAAVANGGRAGFEWATDVDGGGPSEIDADPSESSADQFESDADQFESDDALGGGHGFDWGDAATDREDKS